MIIRKDGLQNFDSSLDIDTTEVSRITKVNIPPTEFKIQFKKTDGDILDWEYRDIDERDMDYDFLIVKEYFKFQV
jgi:hypothetical protein